MPPKKMKVKVKPSREHGPFESIVQDVGSARDLARSVDRNHGGLVGYVVSGFGQKPPARYRKK